MSTTKPTTRSENVARQYGSYLIMQDGEGQPKFLGKGTFGRTYLAQHQYLETLAALKVINERYAAEASARESFLREGKALVRLDHHHIARLLDFGESDGALFYAMEYCAGGDLAQRVQALGPLPIDQWLVVARQLTRALECCHRAGFIHRDLKPSNIMLAHEGDPLVVKLIDFGLVHAEKREREGDPAVVGTPLYASPEQLREEKIDARSDLFSLGVTLWHLAIGAPPETGSYSQIIASRLSPDSYTARLPPHLPASVRTLLGRLLEKDVAGRPESAVEVTATLKEIARELGIVTAGESTAAEGPASARRPAFLPPSPPRSGADRSHHRRVSARQRVGKSTPPLPSKNTARTTSPIPRARPRQRPPPTHPSAARLDSMLFRMLRVAVAKLTAGSRGLECLRPTEIRAYVPETVVVSPAPQGEQLSAH